MGLTLLTRALHRVVGGFEAQKLNLLLWLLTKLDQVLGQRISDVESRINKIT